MLQPLAQTRQPGSAVPVPVAQSTNLAMQSLLLRSCNPCFSHSIDQKFQCCSWGFVQPPQSSPTGPDPFVLRLFSWLIMASWVGQKTKCLCPKRFCSSDQSKYTVNLYLKLSVYASIHERAHAFFTNKAALDQIKKKIPMQMYLDYLGIQLGCDPFAQGLVYDWTMHSDNWCHPNPLEILSFQL